MNRLFNKAIEVGSVSHSVETLKGITVHVDCPGEEVWVETAPDFNDVPRLVEINAVLECMGFSLIEEEPPTEMEDGSLRHHYEQWYFPMDATATLRSA